MSWERDSTPEETVDIFPHAKVTQEKQKFPGAGNGWRGRYLHSAQLFERKYGRCPPSAPPVGVFGQLSDIDIERSAHFPLHLVRERPWQEISNKPLDDFTVL